MSEKCPYCKRLISWDDAIWDAERQRFYHQSCIIARLSRRVEELKKKAKRGTITLEEAEEGKLLDLELKGWREIEARPKRPEENLLHKALASTAPVFSNKDPRYIDVGAVSRRLRSSTAVVKVDKEETEQAEVKKQ